MPNIERLTQLARVVRAAPEHRFHMRTFMEKTTCGTAYCAAGWAFVDPWFTEHKFHDIWTTGTEHIWTTEDELAEYFGLSNRDANRLFALDINRYAEPHAVTKGEVLANIEQLLAGLPAELYDAVSADDDTTDDSE